MAGVWERVVRFFRGNSEKRRIDMLSERRAKLTARRDVLYGEIQRLERRERELLEQGRESESAAQKRRLASQLAQVRKDLERRNTAVNVLGRNVDVLSTHIHHLELLDSTREAAVPDSAEINAVAIQIDEVIARIKEESDLVAGIEADRSHELLSSEESDILREFEAGRSERETAPSAKSQTQISAPSLDAQALASIAAARLANKARADAEPPRNPTEARLAANILTELSGQSAGLAQADSQLVNRQPAIRSPATHESVATDKTPAEAVGDGSSSPSPAATRRERDEPNRLPITE